MRIWTSELPTQEQPDRVAGLSTIRVELACGGDFRRCHSARDVPHLLADVVAPGAGRKGLELCAQIDHRLSAEPSRAGLAVDATVTGPTGRDPAHRRSVRHDAGPYFGIGGMIGKPRQIGVIRREI